MMYRGAPAPCIGCGRFVELPEADILANGMRCFRCGVREQIAVHESRRPVARRALDALLGLFDADRRLPRTRIGNAAEHGRVRIQGFARPISDERVTAPFSERRCLTWSLQQIDLDEDRVIDRQSRLVDFVIDDGSGLARIDTIGTRARLALAGDVRHREHDHLFVEGVILPGQIVEVIGTIVASLAGPPRTLSLGSRKSEPLHITSW